MMRFDFRLQQYLNIKTQLEEQKELEYANALIMLEREKSKLTDLINQKDSAIQKLRDSLMSIISPLDVKRANQTIDKLKQMIIVQENKVAVAAQNAEHKRLALIEAMKERKAIETVKENQHAEFLIEVDKKERARVDELVSFKYANKVELI